MNRKVIIVILAIAALVIVMVSSGTRNLISGKSAHLVEKVDLNNRQVLLNMANTYKENGNYPKAKIAYKQFVKQFPDSKNAESIRKDLEALNMKILFSDAVTDNSFLYKIKPGDTLVEIALKSGTTVELLKKSNGLKNDLILPGKLLKVNKTKFNILVDKSDNILTLKDSEGEIVKTYTVSTGKNLNTPTGTFTVEEKLVSPVWYKVGAIVNPDSSEYELGSRWMGLSIEGYGIHGTKDPATIGKHITKGCVRMKNEDVEELYAVIPSGTKVTIVE